MGFSLHNKFNALTTTASINMFCLQNIWGFVFYRLRDLDRSKLQESDLF